jgi:23S rRNA pseudouridine2604 synthase
MTDSIRINKYLADQGVTSRTEADKLIAAGKVKLNGRQAKLGDRVGPKDTVTVLGTTQKRYFAYNKPRGVITHSPGPGEKDIASQLPSEFQGLGLFPVGRLDKDSHGLILLTNDGRITKRLLDPSLEHEKEYHVAVGRELTTSTLTRMAKGVFIEGYVTKPATVHARGAKSFSITLTEGKKHQIRRMVAAFGAEVTDLKRVRVGKLGSGDAKGLEGEVLHRFLLSVGLG